ncbi:MAG: hypothetical protein IKY66_05335 [Bacteroidales bacterium]|nr:hypothetical protein [Bacteroidales bacterium]
MKMYVMAICGDLYLDCVTVKEAREWAKKVMGVECASCDLYKMHKDGRMGELYDHIHYESEWCSAIMKKIKSEAMGE